MDEITFGRRAPALLLFGGAGAAVLVGCASDDASSSDAGATPTDCEELPEETAGPYPGDGSNGPNVLTESGVVRSDIRSSFGSSSGTAEGVDLAIDLTVLAADGCTPLSGAAVYLWHCDREGRYSLYSQGVEDQNYLRGVQEARRGRRSASRASSRRLLGALAAHPLRGLRQPRDATAGGDPRATSQLALPQDGARRPTRRRATRTASRTWPAPRSRATTCSGTATTPSSPR